MEKVYRTNPAARQGRHSHPVCIGAKSCVEGEPDYTHISASYVELANLSIPMRNRRFTRLTNALSKKFQNHVHMLALYLDFYNFVRVQKSLRMSPAIAAGVTNVLWTMDDILERIESRRPHPGKRGPYKKRAKA